MFRLLTLSVVVLTTASHAFMMSPPQAPSRFLIGHEELTREGIDIANSLLKKDFFPMPEFMVPASKNENNLVIGNYLTDFPDDKYKSILFDLRAFYKIDTSENWHTHKETQSMHSLRDYDIMTDLTKSCQKIQQRIVTAAKWALVNYLDGKSIYAQLFTGHATHILQDSFSPVHVKRATIGDGIRVTNMIKDICIYGAEHKALAQKLGVCYHKVVDHKEFVWTRKPDREIVNSLSPDGSNIGHMGDMARSSAYATALFLRELAQIVENSSSLGADWAQKYLETKLMLLFEKAPSNVHPMLGDMFPQGLLNCSKFVEDGPEDYDEDGELEDKHDHMH